VRNTPTPRSYLFGILISFRLKAVSWLTQRMRRHPNISTTQLTRECSATAVPSIDSIIVTSGDDVSVFPNHKLGSLRDAPASSSTQFRIVIPARGTGQLIQKPAQLKTFEPPHTFLMSAA